MNDEFTGLRQVLGQQRPPHVTAQGVLEGEVGEDVPLVRSAVIMELYSKRQVSQHTLGKLGPITVLFEINRRNMGSQCSK